MTSGQPRCDTGGLLRKFLPSTTCLCTRDVPSGRVVLCWLLVLAKAARRSGRAQGDDVAVGGGGPVDGDGHRIASHGGGGIRDDHRGVERRIACRQLFQENLR